MCMSNIVFPNSKAPDFCLKDEDGNDVCLHNFRGGWVVLYFYPCDNTSGCTREAKDFTEKPDDFLKRNAVVLGISPDSVLSHKKFIEKHELKVTLLSDPDLIVLKRYNVWRLKKYGRQYYGVVRSTF